VRNAEVGRPEVRIARRGLRYCLQRDGSPALTLAPYLRFVADAEHDVDRSQFNAAEARRLAFKVESAELSQHVESLGAELSDLILRYARLAQRPVTLTPREEPRR
jgi:hypothetical protein